MVVHLTKKKKWSNASEKSGLNIVYIFFPADLTKNNSFQKNNLTVSEKVKIVVLPVSNTLKYQM